MDVKEIANNLREQFGQPNVRMIGYADRGSIDINYSGADTQDVRDKLAAAGFTGLETPQDTSTWSIKRGSEPETWIVPARFLEEVTPKKHLPVIGENGSMPMKAWVNEAGVSKPAQLWVRGKLKSPNATVAYIEDADGNHDHDYIEIKNVNPAAAVKDLVGDDTAEVTRLGGNTVVTIRAQFAQSHFNAPATAAVPAR